MAEELRPPAEPDAAVAEDADAEGKDDPISQDSVETAVRVASLELFSRYVVWSRCHVWPPDFRDLTEKFGRPNSPRG